MVDKTPNATVEINKLAVQILTYNLPKRLFIYGGSRQAGDNGAFYHASRNVLKDYNNDLPSISFFVDKGNKSVISALKKQRDNSIQSLDLFCHGDPDAIYFILGASMAESISKTDIYEKN